MIPKSPDYTGKVKPRILIVDDKPENLLALKKVLEELEAELIEASSGNEALQKTLNHEFALALVDVQMPGMDGYELAEIIRSEVETSNIPIIFISAIYTDRLNVFRGYEKGAFSFITKPFEPVELLNKVRFFISKYHTEKAFQDSRKKYMDLYNSSPDMLASIDMETFTIVECNRTLLRQTGYTRDELIGKSIYDLYDPGCISKVRETFSNCREKREVENVELTLRSKEGTFTEVLFNCKGITDLDGKVIYSNSSLRNISELKEAREKLEQTLRNLQRSNSELETLVYITSHDLQEPMLTVLSSINLLEERMGETLDEEARAFLNYSLKAANRMKELVTSLLDYLRLGNNGANQKMDLNELVREVVDEMHGSIKGKEAEVVIRKLPRVFVANKEEMKHLFQNLISNGIKFSRESIAPNIEINAAEDNGLVTFSVKDNGIGIKRSNFDRVFQVFKQLHDHGEYSGMGMGMAACKKIVESRGGKIWLDSEEGKGSIFYFTLPQKTDAQPPDHTRDR